MILKEALKKGIEILRAENIEAPAVEAGVLLCFVLDKDRTFLYAHPEFALGKEQEEKYLHLLERRTEGVPVQYLTGVQEFMSLDFKVNNDVLVPRPDTEILVEAVINLGKERGDEREINILDIGTGSGCIAICLAYYIKNSRVTAIDISAGALKTAKENAAALGVEKKINFLKSNLFENLENCMGIFDVIVSNPPYIPTEDIKELQVEVRDFEPLAALDGGMDGLDFYRAIIKSAVRYLRTNGILAFEVGYDQTFQVVGLMQKSFCNIDVVKDLAGIGRVVVGRLR